METTPKTIEFYKETENSSPYLDWINGLKDGKAQTVIAARLARLTTGNFGDCKTLQNSELFELRIHIGPGYRIYFGIDEETVVLLLCAGDKSTSARTLKEPINIGTTINGGNVMRKLTGNYNEEFLYPKLRQDPQFAVDYLNECMQDTDPRTFLVALRDIATARGENMAALARNTGIRRTSLYRVLSETGNPELNTLLAILDELGFGLEISLKPKQAG
jgi:putative addiction module killer protein/probable addiction module antidote protein